MRLAACRLVRTRFVGRADMERAAERSLVGLTELEARLGLATQADVEVAKLNAQHEEALRATPKARQRAEDRYRAIEHLAGAAAGWCASGWCRGCTGNCTTCQHAARLLKIGQLWAVPSMDALRVINPRVSPTSRVAWPPASPEVPFAERLAAFKARRLVERAEAAKKATSPLLRAAYEDCQYRQCSAGHTTEIEITSVARGVSCSATKGTDWTKYRESKGRYGYPEQTSTHTIRVRPDWLERVAAHGAQVALGRSLVLDLEIVERDVDGRPLWGNATWVVQGRGTEIDTKTGWLVRVGAQWCIATSERARKALLVKGAVEDVRLGTKRWPLLAAALPTQAAAS
jgi:hypothetical protein